MDLYLLSSKQEIMIFFQKAVYSCSIKADVTKGLTLLRNEILYDLIYLFF